MFLLNGALGNSIAGILGGLFIDFSAFVIFIFGIYIAFWFADYMVDRARVEREKIEEYNQKVKDAKILAEEISKKINNINKEVFTPENKAILMHDRFKKLIKQKDTIIHH